MPRPDLAPNPTKGMRIGARGSSWCGGVVTPRMCCVSQHVMSNISMQETRRAFGTAATSDQFEPLNEEAADMNRPRRSAQWRQCRALIVNRPH